MRGEAKFVRYTEGSASTTAWRKTILCGLRRSYCRGVSTNIIVQHRSALLTHPSLVLEDLNNIDDTLRNPLSPVWWTAVSRFRDAPESFWSI